MPRSLHLALAAAVLGGACAMAPAPTPRTGVDAPVKQADSTPGVVVFDLQDDATLAQIEAFETRHGVDLTYSSDVSADEALLRAMVDDPAALIARTAGDPLIEVAEPVVELAAYGYPDDPLWDQQWNMALIDAPTGWRVGAGSGVRVAVLDTGVTQVEDLGGVRVDKGRSFVPGAIGSADDHGHGTHVAGTIAQATNNGLGVAGVAPHVTVVPYKVLSGRGLGSSDRIAAAVDHAADAGVEVMNLSLGGGHSQVLHKAVEDAVARGVIVVAAAGNTGRKGVGCPGHAEGVIGVSAVGPTDKRSSYTSWGPGVELSAPGGDLKLGPEAGVIQDTIDGKGGHAYRAFQGTSMASPHVAGAAAVLRGMGLDAETTTSVLLDSARDLGEPGFDEVYGHGRLDLGAAVQSVLLQHRGVPFGLGALVGGLLAAFAGVAAGVRRRVWLAGAVTAGGLFFLPLLPLRPMAILDLASRGLVSWPALLVGPDWAHFPLWVSALPMVVLAFVLGLSRSLGPYVAGICAGFGTALIHGASSGAIDPWWLGLGLDRMWLSMNGTVCLLAALAVLGFHKLNHSKGAS